jgi:hypothetical protein
MLSTLGPTGCQLLIVADAGLPLASRIPGGALVDECALADALLPVDRIARVQELLGTNREFFVKY